MMTNRIFSILYAYPVNSRWLGGIMLSLLGKSRLGGLLAKWQESLFLPHYSKLKTYVKILASAIWKIPTNRLIPLKQSWLEPYKLWELFESPCVLEMGGSGEKLIEVATYAPWKSKGCRAVANAKVVRRENATKNKTRKCNYEEAFRYIFIPSCSFNPCF